MNELELIRACKQGDPKGQQEFFDTFSSRLFRIGFRYLRDDLEAEDVVIIAFTRAFRSLNTFNYQGSGSLEAWLRKILVNEALMVLRRKHNFNLTESVEESLPEPNWQPFQTLEAEDIYRMVATLPTGYRTVFNLYVVEGYRHEEISSLLGINEGTSRSQLFKAKSLLQQMLTREGYRYGT